MARFINIENSKEIPKAEDLIQEINKSKTLFVKNLANSFNSEKKKSIRKIKSRLSSLKLKWVKQFNQFEFNSKLEDEKQNYYKLSININEKSPEFQRLIKKTNNLSQILLKKVSNKSSFVQKTVRMSSSIPIPTLMSEIKSSQRILNLTKEENEFLNQNVIPNKNYTMNLLYDCNSKNDFYLKKLYKKTQNKGPILILGVSENGTKFGVYNNRGWKSNPSNLIKSSTIFCLTHQTIHPNKVQTMQNEKSYTDSENFEINWGSGDLIIRNNCCTQEMVESTLGRGYVFEVEGENPSTYLIGKEKAKMKMLKVYNLNLY